MKDLVKICTFCKKEKIIDYFTKRNRYCEKRRSQCKECIAIQKNEKKVMDPTLGNRYYKNHLDSVMRWNKENMKRIRKHKKNYKKRNPWTVAANDAKRRAALLQRIPKWADLRSISEFYRNRPKGHHVDHVIPLNGKNVSGLHILSNLQYLPAIENEIKSNKFQ